MRFAICDRDEALLSRLKKLTYQYAKLNKLDIVVDCYQSGENLLDSPEYYNMVFLGYSLLGINGLETAKKMRKAEINSSIVFVSDRTDFIFEAFKVNTYRFIRKCELDKQLFDTLEDFFHKFGNDCPLWIKSDDDIVCVNANDVYFLEADNKHCKIHLENCVLRCNRTMAKVYSVLPKKYFSKTNRAYIVNLNKISRYNNDVIYMKNGETIHPSRNYYRSFKDDYRRFLRPCVL